MRRLSGVELGPVTLSVSSLPDSIRFYERALGLITLKRTATTAAVGTEDAPLVYLEAQASAHVQSRSTGMFHVAFLFPERRALASWLDHALQTRVPLSGMSDHNVSEAIYLSDPDGHGIEMYADRPRKTWEGHVADRLTSVPLDQRDLLGELDRGGPAFDAAPRGTRVGHVHLKVSDVASAVTFYRDLLGLELMADVPGAAFLAAGGYHHHVGVNTWYSAGASPSPPGAARLIRVEIAVPSDALAEIGESLRGADVPVVERSDGLEVQDPAGNPLALMASAT